MPGRGRRDEAALKRGADRDHQLGPRHLYGDRRMARARDAGTAGSRPSERVVELPEDAIEEQGDWAALEDREPADRRVNTRKRLGKGRTGKHHDVLLWRTGKKEFADLRRHSEAAAVRARGSDAVWPCVKRPGPTRRRPLRTGRQEMAVGRILLARLRGTRTRSGSPSDGGRQPGDRSERSSSTPAGADPGTCLRQAGRRHRAVQERRRHTQEGTAATWNANDRSGRPGRCCASELCRGRAAGPGGRARRAVLAMAGEIQRIAPPGETGFESVLGTGQPWPRGDCTTNSTDAGDGRSSPGRDLSTGRRRRSEAR